MHLRLRRNLSLRPSGSLSRAETMVTYCHIHTHIWFHCRDSATVLFPTPCHFLWLLVLAVNLGLHDPYLPSQLANIPRFGQDMG